MEEVYQHNMDYELFRRCLTDYPAAMNDTWFGFLDDPEYDECILGYNPTRPPRWSEITKDPDSCRPRKVPDPYWVGDGCDVKGGAGFATADELLNAKVYGGRSIAEGWEHVCVYDLGGFYKLETWFKYHSFPETVVCEDGVWRFRG